MRVKKKICCDSLGHLDIIRRSASPDFTLARSVKPHRARFSCTRRTASGRRSTNTASAAPRLRASMPSWPVPAKRSSTRRPDAVRLVQENLALCGFTDRARVKSGDALAYLKSGEKFDLIFLDPPYAADLLEQALTAIASFDICREHGIIVAESAADKVLPELPAPYRLYREYRYGKIRLSVYHRSGNEDETT